MTNKKKVFFILGSGGHTAQMLLLQKDFSGKEYDKYFILDPKDTLSLRKVDPLEQKGVFFVDRYKRTEESLTSAFIRNIIFFQIYKQIYQSINIVGKMNKSLLITAGPNLGIFVFIISRLKGNYCVFMESWSRRNKLSKTGGILKIFASLFLVQWEDLEKLDRKFIFAGRML